MYDNDKRKLFSALSHGSIFFSATLVAIGVPIAFLIVSDDPVVKDNAKEAVNFHLNVWFYGAIIAALSFVTFGLFGWVFGPFWFLLHWGLTIWAIIHCLGNTEQPYRYPFIFRPL
ncbi:hypothetical protein BST81_20430 [Leptolyngbya sp. 'hensonii']|uniref:DUF4870 domain-containing protein n=1 Tax=Leptolyngbya sp. 'hensonii' TaxID=1922337 RepID=UPI00094F878A|nr:DUF4870 domain-containing protein [Leptolyngbya sp. 'hensonii']OLP16567.1 hypothetical protein BST81_20430 [Leptolyngbya sp. 'hensonii']